jgi:hypothetical protein
VSPADETASTSGPAFVVLRAVGDDTWQLLGEVPRRRGLPARKARRQAVFDVTGGTVEPSERYAAVLRSEWRVALDV